MSSPSQTLDDLRGQIDDIDDALHDLIMRRADVVRRIADRKAGEDVFLRPSREAAILRRLAERHHGSFPLPVLIRAWRELLAGFTRVQGPFAIAVYATEQNRELWDVARDHYGSTTPIQAVGAPLHAISAVVDGRATVAVVPWPDSEDPNPWWPALLAVSERTPRVVARLPFVEFGEVGYNRVALAVGCVAHEPTGEDDTLLNLGLPGPVSRGRLKDELEQVGLRPVAFWSSMSAGDGEEILQLVEIDGFVADGDERLGKLAERLGQEGVWTRSLGGFAKPLRLPASARKGDLR